MPKLTFRDFINSYTLREDVVGKVPPAIRQNADAAEVQSWSELEHRLRAAGADDDLCSAGKRLWRRYRVAARSSLT
jgi:hypothetical protein